MRFGSAHLGGAPTRDPGGMPWSRPLRRRVDLAGRVADQCLHVTDWIGDVGLWGNLTCPKCQAD